MSDHYQRIETEIAVLGLDISASEIHGLICGAITNHLHTSIAPNLLQLIEPSAVDRPAEFSALNERVHELYRASSMALLDDVEGFELVLPEEDATIADRAEALGQWCKGFLLGLLHNDALSIDQLQAESAEIARDFMQIAEVEAGHSQEQEEDWALAELHEYVKVGAQLIFEHIYSAKASQAPTTLQ